MLSERVIEMQRDIDLPFINYKKVFGSVAHQRRNQDEKIYCRLICFLETMKY